MQVHADTANVVAEFPATASQRRFWYLHQIDPTSVASNIAVHWEMHGACPAEIIEEAFQAIIARHEILRTRFEEREGVLFQQVVASTEFRLSTIDLRNVDEHEHQSRIAGIATELSDRPFDLGQPGHLRVALVRSQQDRTSILIGAHHAVFDGFSIRVLGHELGAIAAALVTGVDPDLPELNLQYGDYGLWQEACESKEAQSANATYWHRQLADMPYFSLPHDRPAPPATQRSGGRLDVPLGEDFGARLDALARDLNTSAFAVGSAVAAAALHRITGATDVSFGTTFAGRSETELEELIGVFINPIVLRMHVKGSDTLSAAVRQSTSVVRQALAHGDYPFDQLVKDLHPPRDPQRTSLVSVLFSLQPVFLQEQTYGPLCLVSLPSKTPAITHDVAINVTGRASGWIMMIDYDVNRFDRRSVDALGILIRDAFEIIFDQPKSRLEDLPYERVAPASVRKMISPPAPPAAVNTGRPATEARLREIWASYLDLPPENCDGDFFELGGHSLLVLRMLAQVGAEFGVKPGIPDFLEAPTLSAFSSHLTAKLEPVAAEANPVLRENFKLIWLRENAPDAPLVLSINQPFLYLDLARKLDDRFACANLHLANLDDLRTRPDGLIASLVDEAASVIAGMSRGCPVTLLGQCVDGLLAYRIALRLAEQGRPVQTLAMIDSWAPRQSAPKSPLRNLVSRYVAKSRRIASYSTQFANGQLGLQNFLSKSSLGKRALIRLGRFDPPTEAEQQELEINRHLQDLVRAEAFPAYSGDTILFASASQTRRALTERFAWNDRLPADVPVFTLPGWHEDALLQSGTAEIAAIFAARIDRAELGWNEHLQHSAMPARLILS